MLVPYVLALKSHDVTPSNVVAASPSDPTVVALSRYLGAEPGINSIRLTGNVVGGIYSFRMRTSTGFHSDREIIRPPAAADLFATLKDRAQIEQLAQALAGRCKRS